MVQKLFGSSSSSKFSPKKDTTSAPKAHGSKKKVKVRSRLRPLKVVLSILLVLEVIYCIAIFTNIPFIERLRTMYIKTALSTMNHQWLATALIPKDIVDDVAQRMDNAREEQIGMNSSWENVEKPTSPPPVENVTEPTNDDVTEPTAAATEDPMAAQRDAFFQLFWELDQDSMMDYVEENPSVLDNGWENIYINEAGLDDNGTSIQTTMGEKVLAIDAKNQIMLLRVTGSTYRGILAVAKDPSRLFLGVSEGIGSYGQRAGTIAENYNGLLAITASGFIDEDGGGNGGQVSGACMADGETYGRHFGWGYKRVELHSDDRLYIMDAPEYFSDDATDAAEFWPALIIDGENALGRDNIFTELNPRACIGQSASGEILLLVIEGRSMTSLGTDAEECVEILLRHDCYQGMNMDGGTSAIMWYDGEYVTRCSNVNLPEGRQLPNAWIYGRVE